MSLTIYVYFYLPTYMLLTMIGLFFQHLKVISMHIWYTLSPIDNLCEIFYGNEYGSVLMSMFALVHL